MNLRKRTWAALIAAAAVADLPVASAQGPVGYQVHPRDCWPNVSRPGGIYEGGPAVPLGQGAEAGSSESLTSESLDVAQRGPAGSNIAAAGAGATAAAAAAAGVTFTTISNPLVIPGLLTASQTEAIRPSDRIYFNYSYYDSFQVIRSLTILPTTTTRATGFDLHRFDVGAEVTLLDNRASVYVRAPFLDAVNNTTPQNIESFGNVAAGFKFVLLDGHNHGPFVSAGLTVSAPTGRAATFPAFANLSTTPDSSDPFMQRQLITGQTDAFNVKLNPTFLQPWLGVQLGCDKLFVENYCGVILSSDERVPTFINNNFTVGYNVYHCESDSLLSAVTPTVSLQALIPTEQRGSDALPFGFSDQFFLSSGVNIGLGCHTTLSGAVVTPISGPRAFDMGFMVGVSFSR